MSPRSHIFLVIILSATCLLLTSSFALKSIPAPKFNKNKNSLPILQSPPRTFTTTSALTATTSIGCDVSEIKGVNPFVLHVPALRRRSPSPSFEAKDVEDAEYASKYASMSSTRMELRRAELKSVFGPIRVLPRAATRRARDEIQGI
mmetsp:Transcript_12731/g.25306  ORF Transcript_12731/g.25306 Transcript_12731/m.25306 type:complete len:147 (-) Transcript_12731:83-523(-)